MGIVSILLGAITFFVFTGAGAILANNLVEQKQVLSMAITSLRTVSDTSLMVGVVGMFAFIGLLIGVSLIMHGLTYNRIAKLQSQLKRRM